MRCTTASLLTVLVVALLGDCVCDPLAADGTGDEGEGEEGGGGEGEGDGGEVLAPEICLDGWCWENPRPFAFDIEGVWPVAENDVWLAVTGGRMLHWDGASFSTGQTLEGAVRGFAPISLFGTSSTSLWAAAGRLFHFDGTTWLPVATPGLPDNALLVDVFGTGDDDLWVVGQTPPLLFHFDGTTWTDHTPAGHPPSAMLFAGQAIAPDDAWVVGMEGTVLRWDGATWTPNPVGDPSAIFEGVWMSASDDVWVTGRTPSALFHWDGAAWTSEPAPNARPVSHLWGSASDDIWGGGPNGVLHHWDGQLWSAVDFLSLPTFQLGAVEGRARNDIWTVGDGGVIARFDGQRWTRPGQGNAFTALIADVDSSGDAASPWVVAVGQTPISEAVFRRGEGGAWSLDDKLPPFLDPLRAIATTGPDDIWVGGDSEFLHFDGTDWAPVALPEGLGQANDLCALAADDAWGLFSDPDAVDPALAVVRFNGTAWVVDARIDGASADADDEMARGRLFCLDDGSLWAGGPGFLLRRDDVDGWVREGDGTDPALDHPVRLQQVGDALMAVDAFGRLWARGGTTWTASFVPERTERDVSAALLVSPTEAFLLDDSGVLEHLRDGARTRALSPFQFGLQAIEPVGADVFAVGGFGAVLRRER